MKKALSTIAAVFGCFGLATLTIFLVETAGMPNNNIPAGNLIANIASNDLAAEPATAGTPGAGVPAPASAPSSSPQPLPTPLSSPQPDQLPQVQAAPPPSPTPPPLVPLNDPGSNATSSAATATITVTTTPPPAPPLPPPAVEQPPTVGAGSLALPYDESNFTGDQNWQGVWGNVDLTWSGSLDLAAGPGSTGGMVYLKNADGWANYTFTATLDWIGGKVFDLIAGYRDASNYALCEYVRTGPVTATIQLLEYTAGKRIALTPAAAASSSAANGSDLNASITIGGLYGTCSLEGRSITNATIGPGNTAMNAPVSGSIGFAVNDPAPNTSQIIVKRVEAAAN